MENILPCKENTKAQQEGEDEHMLRVVWKRKHKGFQSAARHVLSERTNTKLMEQEI